MSSTDAAADTSPLPVLVYELVNANDLPTIDVTRSVKSALCSTRGVKHVNALVRRTARLMKVLYVASLPFDVALFFVSETTGWWFALVKVAGQTPLLLSTLASLRTDILKCLLRTYEFWFLSLVNVGMCAVYCAYFGDVRAAAMVVYCLGVQLGICVDAALYSRHIAVTSFVYLAYHFAPLIAATLQLTPGTHQFTLLADKKHAIKSDDFLMNSLSTVVLLMARTVYRKRQFLKRQSSSGNATVIRCVSYRCRVKLRVRDASSSLVPQVSRPTATNETRPPDAPPATRRQQLRFVSQDTTYYEDDVVSKRLYDFVRDPSERVQRWRTGALYSVGMCGLVFNLLPFVIRKYSFHDSQFVFLSAFANTCTMAFVAVFVGCYNRKLLRELASSFDFCFFSAHLTLVHVCVCDVFFWDNRCFFVMFNWLAMHWVLTLDALTPKLRQRLGLRVRFVIPVVVFFVLGICRISLDMVSLTPTRPLQDRLLISLRAFSHRLEFRVGPFVLNRAWTLLLWCLRTLWRLSVSHEDDRIILQGQVEFVANRSLLSVPDFGSTLGVAPAISAEIMREWTVEQKLHDDKQVDVPT